MEMSTAKAALMQGEEIELNDINNEEWDVAYDRKPAKVKQYRCYIIIAKPNLNSLYPCNSSHCCMKPSSIDLARKASMQESCSIIT